MILFFYCLLFLLNAILLLRLIQVECFHKPCLIFIYMCVFLNIKDGFSMKIYFVLTVGSQAVVRNYIERFTLHPFATSGSIL